MLRARERFPSFTRVATELDVTAYAVLLARLASSGERRADVLAEHGLDEEGWAAIDDAWQERLSAAMDDEGTGGPTLIGQFDDAYSRAQAAPSLRLTLEQFAQVTRWGRETGDLVAALAQLGATTQDYVAATAHYSRRIATEPGTREAFERAMRAARWR